MTFFEENQIKIKCSTSILCVLIISHVVLFTQSFLLISSILFMILYDSLFICKSYISAPLDYHTMFTKDHKTLNMLINYSNFYL